MICYCEYECEYAQYDYESPNIEESYLINEYVNNVEYEIDEDYSKNDSTDISYDEYTSFMDRVKEQERNFI